jgi:hypothetical protein
MDSHPFPCNICGKAVDLTVDLCADENAKHVHEDCYVKHITTSRSIRRHNAGRLNSKPYLRWWCSLKSRGLEIGSDLWGD